MPTGIRPAFERPAARPRHHPAAGGVRSDDVALDRALFFVGLAALFSWRFPAGGSASSVSASSARRSASASRWTTSWSVMESASGLAHALNLAGIDDGAGTFALRVVLALGGAGARGSALVGPVFALIGLVAPALVPGMVVRSKGRKRQEAFAAQLPDVLQLLITSLRSGLQPAAGARRGGPRGRRTGSLRVRAHAGRDPHRCGLRHRHESHGPADGVDRPGVGRSAVDINRETGGNLAEVLDERHRHHPRAVPAAPADQDAHCRGSHVGEGPDRPADPDLRRAARCSTAPSVT